MQKPTPSTFWSAWVPVLLIVVAVTLTYMNSVYGAFVFDDIKGIVDNPYIRTLWPISEVLFNSVPGGPADGRPVVSLSLAINYAIGGLDVFDYHIFNIVIHLAASLVLFGICRQTFLGVRLRTRFGQSASFLAFAVAIIWAVHPIQTESVTYITTRTESMMGLFYLLTLYCAVRSWESNNPQRWNVMAILSCAIGMGCKEAMASAPLMVLFYDVLLVSGSWRKALRKHIYLYVGLAATWGLLIGVILSGPRSNTCGWHLGLSALDYLRTQAGIIVWYLRLCFWPDPLVVSYEGWPLAKTFSAVWPQGLFIIVLLALTVWGMWRRYPASLLGIWFFMLLAPTSSFLPIVTEIAAERRMYLPSAAVIVVTIVSIYEITRWINCRLDRPIRGVSVIAMMTLFFVVVGLGATTHMRNRDYISARAIWADTVAKRPNNGMALSNLAHYLQLDGEYEKAIEYCDRAIVLSRTDAEAHNNRGVAYVGIGQYAEAVRDFDRAIELKTATADFHSNRGHAHDCMGDYKLAIADYTRAIELDSAYAEAYNNRAITYIKLKDYDRAIADYTRAIELKTGFIEAYRNRATAYFELGKYKRAIQDYSRAIEMDPQYSQTYHDRGNAYLAVGDYKLAKVDYGKAIALKPDDPVIYNNRGVAHNKTKTYDLAMNDFDKAIELNSDYADAYYNRGNAYLGLRDFRRAIMDYDAAIGLKNDYAQAYNNRAIARCSLKEYDKAWSDIEKCHRHGGRVKPGFIERLERVASRPATIN